MGKEKGNEVRRFTRLVDQLLAVPHSEIKAKLDAEKAAKKRKKDGKVKRDDH